MAWSDWAPMVGVVVGSVLTYGGQALADRRALRRDERLAEATAQRQDEAEWLTLQRQTIVDLQNALELIWVTSHPPADRPDASLREEVAEEAARTALRLHALMPRLQDQELAEDIRTWLHSELDRDRARADVNGLQARLGAALRATHRTPG